MATSFDRWEKDPFFLAAEEVQESADRYALYRFLFVLIDLRYVPVPALMDLVFVGAHSRRMESVYKIWVQERSGAGGPEAAAALRGEVSAVELRRELHTALGTAKWQVNLSALFLSLVSYRPFLQPWIAPAPILPYAGSSSGLLDLFFYYQGELVDAV
jgi:hypothetical protein